MAQHYKKPDVTKARIKNFTGWQGFNPKGNVAPGRMNQNLCGRLWTNHCRDCIELSVASPSAAIVNPTSNSLEALGYRSATIGQSFGPTFATHVFRLDITVPSSFHGLSVHLLWDSNSEALILSEDGTPQQGLVGGDHWCRRADYPLFSTRPEGKARGDDTLRLYIEIACNGLFGAGRGGDIEPPDLNRVYKLEECCLAVFNPPAWNLIHDLTLLSSLADHLPEGPRRANALHIANEVVNAVQVDDPATYEQGRDIARSFLSSKNGDSQSVVHSMLHSHIDLAWLWPMASTPGKAARTFSTQLRLMDQYPECIYVQSQAQLFQWVKDFYPKLWTEIRRQVSAGRFVPVGATWVEMDCNIPSGESLVRQFLYGQSFFEENFGRRCREFWLPDTFGYCAQLPQIMKGCGVDYFMTQKLSWNLFNKFPHSSFVWEGLDGTQVLAHMPPADTYNAQAFPEEVLRSANKNKDSGVVNRSIMLVGHGDGGGGASPAMLESMARMKNLDGVPRVQFSTPETFFEELKNVKGHMPRWVGELYFELHRGTYTSQANTKKSNRQCEILLRDLESVATQALIVSRSCETDFSYPTDLLHKCWSLLLKNCFHDTLPGSCIQQVYVETDRDYKFIVEQCSRAIDESLTYIKVAKSLSKELRSRGIKRFKTSHAKRLSNRIGEAPNDTESDDMNSALLLMRDFGPRASKSPLVINAHVPTEQLHAKYLVQSSHHTCKCSAAAIEKTASLDSGASIIAVKAPTGGLGLIYNPIFLEKDALGETIFPATAKLLSSTPKVFMLSNRQVTAKICESGRLLSLVLHSSNHAEREVLTGPSSGVREGCGNRLVLFDDVPQFWCAWDTEVYSFEKSYDLPTPSLCKIVEEGPLRAGLKVEYPPTKAGSIVTQYIFLRAESDQLEFHTEVDWKETRKILRVTFDVEVRAPYASYGTQFGYVARPTTFNHSWEIAKFEVVGHQFCDLSEPGFGVALLSDHKYGYSVRDSIMRLSLLRASKSPDDKADQGKHHFMYSVLPHWNAFPTGAVFEGARQLGCPPLVLSMSSHSGGSREREMGLDLTFSIISTDAEEYLISVAISAVKKAERNSQSVIVRLHEMSGSRGRARLRIPQGLIKESAKSCNMLEEEEEDATAIMRLETMRHIGHRSELLVAFTPFQVRTIMIDIAE